MTRSIKLRGSSLIYIAFFLLSITHINLPAISFIHGNAPSLFFCLAFFVINIDVIVKRKWRRQELIFIALVLTSILITLIMTTGKEGLASGIRGYIGLFIVYCSFKIWFHDISNKRLEKSIKSLFWGYIITSCGIGILEAIYIYIWKSPILYGLLKIIVYRNIDNYMVLGRVQFWAEPSFASLYFILILIPFSMAARRRKIISEKQLIFGIILASILNLLTLSSRVYMDIVVFIFVLFICKRLQEKNKNAIIWLGLLLSMFLVIFLFHENIAATFASSNISALRRIGEILRLGIIASGDYSMTIRFELMRCAVQGFFQKPFFGWGVGNFVKALQANYNERNISTWISKQQMLDKLNSSYETSYSFFTTSIAESGILGIGMILCVINEVIKVFRRKKTYRAVVYGIMVLYLLIQYELPGCYVILMWLAIFSTRNENMILMEVKSNC